MASAYDIKEKYGERVISLLAAEIVKAGIERVKEYGESARAMDITLSVAASEIDNQDWNIVRSLIKRYL